jgi:NH3-dependent NAD+ synthetase
MKSFKLFSEKKDNDLAKNDIHKIIEYSKKLQEIIKTNIELEDWVKAKLTHAEDYLNTVYDYLMFYKQDNKNENSKMAVGDLKSILYKAIEIEKLLNKKDIKDWVKAKLNLAGEYMDDIFHHLDYNKNK